MKFPVRYARRNILIGPTGEAAALYRADTVSYPFLSGEQKWALLGRLERFAQLVGADFALWRVCRAYPAEHYPDELADLLDERHGEEKAWRRYTEGHAERLTRLGSHVPEVYVAVSLAEADKGPSALRSFGRARRRMEELAGVRGPRPISRDELEALAAAEQRTLERMGGVVALERASTAELQWLLRRAACRGVAEPELDRNWRPDALVVVAPDGSAAYEPLESDLWRLANAPATEDPRQPPSLMVEAEEGTSHQALLCCGSLAEESEFPGAAELLFTPLEGAGFAIDAVLYAQWVGNREALGQVRKRILDAEHAYREQLAGSASGPGLLAEEDRELAREYEAVLSSTAHPPMLRASVSLAVGAPDRRELERRVTAVRERFGEVVLHRPRGLQHQLFSDHLPQPGGGSVADYRQQMTIEQFAAMVPTATAEVGSPQGIYIGYSPTAGRPVRYDPTEAPLTARPSGVLLAGTLGSGKTLAAEAIAYAAQRRGSLVVDFDPKPDHNLEAVPELAGEVEVLELSGDPDHAGKLDPLAIGLPELREELASSYLLELLRDPPSAWEVAIDRAVRDAVRAGERSLRCVIARLLRSEAEAAREAGEALEVLSDFGLARLGFAPVEAAFWWRARSR
ncbi:MAG TPA: ATP-binding protein [Solirubrobacterales bacterium]|nr:ATP-binding protein [Solirubrobacterales bacterium]